MTHRTSFLFKSFSVVTLLLPLGGCSEGEFGDSDGTDTGGTESGNLDSEGPASGVDDPARLSSGGAESGGYVSGGTTSGSLASGGEDSDNLSAGGDGPDQVSSGGALGSGGDDSTEVPSSGGDSTANLGSGGDDSLATGGEDSGGSGGDSSGSGGAEEVSSGGARAGAAIPPTFSTVKFVIEYAQPSCLSAPCHGAAGSKLPLRNQEQLYSVLTTRNSVACGNIPIVDPGNPEQSALLKILKGACGEIVRMPAGCFENEMENNCIPDDYIAAIEQWIADGAPEQEQ